MGFDKEKARSVGYLRSGYKKSTRTTVKDRRGSRQVEHFDGRMDAQVRPRAVMIKSQAKEL